jgi:cell pole-organizing protein PopZ
MSKPAAKGQDPSMEEILASIRRIISDEGNTQEPKVSVPQAPAASAPSRPAPAIAPKAAASVPEPPLREEPDVLELTEFELAETKAPPAFRPVEAPHITFRDEPQPYREPPATIARRPMAPMAPPVITDQLLSQHASQAVSSAFGSLVHTMSAGDSRSIEDVVREMLKPMLKTWLEENLPSLVERLVRAEIERVSRGGR